MNDSLFQPSLQHVREERPLYSTTTLFMSAFFGGVFAATLVFGVNAWRAARLRRDLVALALAGAGGLVLPLIVLEFGPAESDSATRLLMRLGGVLVAGLLYIRHRGLYRGQELFGVARPNGWGIGLLAVALGFALNLALILLMSGWLAADASVAP